MPGLESLIFSAALAAFLSTGAAKLIIEQLISLVTLFKKLKATIKCDYSLESAKLEMRVLCERDGFSRATRRKKIEAARVRIGTVKEFLGMSDEEAAFVELKLTLCESLKKYRINQGLSQSELAKRLRSSQSRVAKMEASDLAVSVDLLIRALLLAGAKKKDIAEAIAKSKSLAA